MATTKSSFKAPLFLIVSIVAFGAGIILVTAAQKTTENRSKASSGPYTCSTVCAPENGGVGGAACIACTTANTTPSPTPAGNPWADCAQWGADGKCNFTYWQKQEAKETDWRCKDKYLFLGMCEFETGPQEMPSVPRPEEDPGINPGEETF